jgi:protein TonB
MRAMFGERLREATDRGGAPVTALVGGRELASIAVAAMQSRFGQATGRVHRAHDAQDGSDVWRTNSVPALFLQREDRRPLKLATVGALACHFALFLVVFPGPGTGDAIFTPPPPEVTRLRPWEPPPPREEVRPPDAEVRPTPDAPIAEIPVFVPRPVFDPRTEKASFRESTPVAATFAVGLPVAPPTPPNERLRAGTDVELPTLLERIQPEYPEIAVRARRECTMVLESLIGRNGEVLDIRILRGCGMGFDESALEAVYQWRYTPTTVNGRPVEVIANVTVRFQLH